MGCIALYINMGDIYDNYEDDSGQQKSSGNINAQDINDAYNKYANNNASQIQNETNSGNGGDDKLDQSATSGNENTGLLESDNQAKDNSSALSNNANNISGNNTANNNAGNMGTQTSQGSKDASNNPTSGINKETGKEAAGDVGKEIGEDVAKEAGKEIAKEAGKEAGKAAAVEAAADAAAAPTAGASKAAQIGLELASKIGKEIQGLDPHTSNNQSTFLPIMIFIGISVFMLICVYLEKLVPGSLSDHQQTTYSKTLTDRGAEKADIGKIEKEFSQKDLDKYGEDVFLKPGFDDYIYGLKDANGNRDTDTGLRNALHDALCEECFTIVESLGSKSLRKLIYNYDEKKSFETFYENPFPYDLQESQTQNFPRIGDVMAYNGKKHTSGYTSYAPKYNDVNYAEMLSIFTCNPKYNWENCKYEGFNDYIRTKRAKNYYYEMKVKWVVVYKGSETTTDADGKTTKKEVSGEREYNTEEEACNSPDSIEVDGITCDRDSYYCKITIKPFGLRELYLMAEVSPDDKHVDYYRHTNYELLDIHERHARVYMRKDVKEMGPSYADDRSDLSSIYADLIRAYGEAKGRSAWCYIPDNETYNLRDITLMSFVPPGYTNVDFDKLNIDTSNLTDDQIALLKFLVAALGSAYSQADRWGNGVYDCSSLVIRAYRSIGISIAGTGTSGLLGDYKGGTTTGSIYGWGVTNNKISNQLKVGSILVYNHGNSANHAGISHVGIYIGNGQMIDARGVKYGVVQRDVPKKNLYAVINPL